MDQCVEHWGEGLVAGSVAGSRMRDPRFMEWAGRLERLAASPGTIARIFDLIGEFDVREVLPSIRVPTLVMHRRDDTFIKVEHSRYIAERIPGARYVELEGPDNMFAMGDTEAILGEIEEFLTGTRHERRARPHAGHGDVHRHRGLHQETPPTWATATGAISWSATTSCSGARSTATAAARSSARGTASSRPSTARRGRSAAPRRSPKRWRRSGSSSGPASTPGELEVMSDDLGGLAVHIAARVMGLADAGEVLVSGTVKDLVVGSGIDFEDRGTHELRGVPGDWRLFRVT